MTTVAHAATSRARRTDRNKLVKVLGFLVGVTLLASFR